MADEVSTLSIDRVQNGDSDVTSPSTEILSAYLPLVFEVSSSSPFLNPLVQAEVQYHDGTDWAVLGTIKKDEITVSGSDLFRFDVSNILQTILGQDIPLEQTFSTIVTGGNDVVNRFRIRFAQFYEDVLGNIIEQEQITSSEYWVCNALVQADNADQDLDDYILNSTGDNMFLTNMPNNNVVYSDEEIQLTFLVSNDSINYAMYYEEYDLSGVAQGTTTTTATTITNRYGILPINAAEVLSNASSMSKVDVWVQNTDSAVRVSEKKTFIVKQGSSCGTRMLWLNDLGGTDRYSFDGYKRVVKDSSRVGMRRPLTLSYGRNSRGGQTIGSNQTETWTLATGVLSESNMDWLDEMLTSTEVAIFVSAGVYDPVVVRSESVTTTDTFTLSSFVLVFDKARKKITHIA